jgi:hypothetical protein
MTPDPVATVLAGFTLRESSLDPADVLFHAGRASARTPWGWKVSVTGLVLVIAALLGERLASGRNANTGPGEGSPVVGTVPSPSPEPSPGPIPSVPASPWRFGALLRVTDADDLPRSPASASVGLVGPPLTARSSDID